MNTLVARLPAIVKLAALAALVEVVLLRGFLRTGPFLPAADGALGLYSGIQTAGLVAMNAATLFCLLALAAMAYQWGVARRPEAVMLAMATVAMLGANVGLALGAPGLGGPGGLAVSSALSLATLVAALAVVPAPGLHKLGLAALLAPYAAVHYYLIAQAGSSFGLGLPLGGQSFFLAEALAAGAPFALVACLRPRFSKAGLSSGLVAAALFSVAYILRPWIVATASMWTLTFSLFLPAHLYAAALATFVYTLVGMAQEGPQRRLMAWGLVLVALGGLRLDHSYFNLLAITGYLVVAYPHLGAAERQAAELHDMNRLDTNAAVVLGAHQVDVRTSLPRE